MLCVHLLNIAFNLECKPAHCQGVDSSTSHPAVTLDTECGACHIFDHDVRKLNEAGLDIRPYKLPAATATAPAPEFPPNSTIYKEVNREYTCYTRPEAARAVSGSPGSAKEEVPRQAQ